MCRFGAGYLQGWWQFFIPLLAAFCPRAWSVLHRWKPKIIKYKRDIARSNKRSQSKLSSFLLLSSSLSSYFNGCQGISPFLGSSGTVVAGNHRSSSCCWWSTCPPPRWSRTSRHSRPLLCSRLLQQPHRRRLEPNIWRVRTATDPPFFGLRVQVCPCWICNSGKCLQSNLQVLAKEQKASCCYIQRSSK